MHASTHARTSKRTGREPGGGLGSAATSARNSLVRSVISLSVCLLLVGGGGGGWHDVLGSGGGAGIDVGSQSVRTAAHTAGRGGQGMMHSDGPFLLCCVHACMLAYPLALLSGRLIRSLPAPSKPKGRARGCSVQPLLSVYAPLSLA